MICQFNMDLEEPVKQKIIKLMEDLETAKFQNFDHADNGRDGILKSNTAQEIPNASEMNDKIYRYTFIPRVIIAAIWPMCVFYATYQLYLVTTEDAKFNSFHEEFPGIFTKITGRGQDKFDDLWMTLSHDFFERCFLWYSFYGIFARFIQIYMPQALPAFSMLHSFLFLTHLIDFYFLVFLLVELFVFWIIQRLDSKLALWLTALGYFIFMNQLYILEILPKHEPLIHYYLYIVACWIHARCISFYYDTWTRPNRTSFESLLISAQFCFYFPLMVWGPLDYFERYEKHILLPATSAKSASIATREFFRMIVKLGRFIFWALFNELLLHFVYFNFISRQFAYLETIDFGALIAILHWLGQFLQLKYTVLYGIPGAIAEADGLPMLQLPKCIMRIHRSSILWKSIDRGMYNWFIRYLYRPILEIMGRIDEKNIFKPELRRILASLPVFAFVYVWHALEKRILIWAVLNFLCFSAEWTGLYWRRKIDGKYKISPAIWEVFIEPVVTIPLLVMLTITSSLFSASIETAKIMAYRIPTEGYYYTPILLTFTHLGVLVETWPRVRKAVFQRSNKDGF